MNVSNQKPAILSPVYIANIMNQFDPEKYIKQSLVAPLFTPLVAGSPVIMTSNSTTVTDDMIARNLIDCCDESMNAMADAVVKEVLSKTLVYYDKKAPLSAKELFANQAGTQAKLPMPTPTTIYTPATDVIPISKQFLAGQCDYETYFATMAFYARPQTLGFYFANNNAFGVFKLWLDTQIATITASLPAESNQMFSDFNANIDLKDLTESLALRNSDGENNDVGSFARTLIAYLMMYAGQVSSAEFGVLPFDIGELYCPQSVVFINVEKHAHATAKQVATEWNLINQSLTMKIKMASNKQISKLTAAARSLKRLQTSAANATTNANAVANRAANVKFRKTPPNTIDLTRVIKRVLSKMSTVAKSENSYKSIKMTYAKPNRRDPDDFNKQGKMVSQKYKPDLHIYIDTSGSISEQNYQDAIKSCIRMAKALNVNLYFNSFSHILSQCTKLNIKDKSIKQVYEEFRRIPKVDGGTDFEQIWIYINKTQKRTRELSLIITDMEFSAPNHHVKHPKNLYYAPCSHMDWDRITRSAEYFCKSMHSIDPQCRARILF